MREYLLHQQLCSFTPKSWEGAGSPGCEHLQEMSRKEADSKALLNISAGNWILFTSINSQNTFLCIGASGRLFIITCRFRKVKNGPKERPKSLQERDTVTCHPVTAGEWVHKSGSLLLHCLSSVEKAAV